MNESGRSSFMLLQNVCPRTQANAGLRLRWRSPNVCWASAARGASTAAGFAGTIQALVPLDLTEGYQAEMERVFGAGCCYRFAVRPVGGVRIGKQL